MLKSTRNRLKDSEKILLAPTHCKWSVFHASYSHTCRQSTMCHELVICTDQRPRCTHYTMFNLFDAYVLSVLNYGCEIWGFLKAEDISHIHRKFCKQMLHVKMSTNSTSLYAEVGRFPLFIGRQLRIIRYWLKLYSGKNGHCILNSIISEQCRLNESKPYVKKKLV